jgi:ATP-dependent DNA ligase
MTRNGYDFARRFPLVVAAVGALPVRSSVIDGEAIVDGQWKPPVVTRVQ